MKHEITVPEVSDGITAGTVVSLNVAWGDQVEEDQTLLELETDKAVVAIPAPVAGKVTDIKVTEGDKVAIGAVIMSIDAAASAAKQPVEEQPEVPVENPSTAPVTLPPGQQEPLPPSISPLISEQPLDLTPIRRDDQVAPAAPSVRRLARELGVDIYQVQGAGPGGRISAEDVRLYVRETMQRVTGHGAVIAGGEFTGLHAQRPLPDFSKWGHISREPLSQIRELTADAMGYAWSTIPMVTQYDKAAIDNLEKFRKDFNYWMTSENKLTMTAILVKVCATALKAFPQFNSSLDLASKELILKQYQHIGVAVDTPNGLLVPVIKDAGQKGIEELATELNTLAEKTRQRKISPADLEGGCFTISNLGGIGGNAFTPIVYAPQVAILGVSQAELEPIWNGQNFEPQLRLPLSLSYDHRVIDGADGARFLRWICTALEQPIYLAMKG